MRRIAWQSVVVVVVVGLLAPWVGFAAEERVVAIVPLGAVEQDLLDEVARAVAAKLAVKTRFDEARALPPVAFYRPRSRYRAEKLLDFIDAAPPPGAWKAIAVTEAEISTTKGAIKDWGIAGLGNIDGLSCVVSTYIYRKHSRSRGVLLRRVGDLAVHEFGHTIGLEHCPTEGCVMRDAKGKALASADTSTGRFCAACRARLAPAVRALLRDPPEGGATTSGTDAGTR